MMNLALVIAAIVATTAGFPSRASAEPNLIGGKIAKRGQSPFIVMINGCTGTKIAPYEFLTAAHCFFSGPGKWEMPKRVRIDAPEITPTRHYPLDVKAVRLHPTWTETCRNQRCTGHETGSATDTPGKVDIAHIIVADPTREIPSIAVEFTPLAVDTAVTFVGYGCNTTIGGPGYGRLRYAENRIGKPELLKHPGSLYAPIAEITGESNWITPGTAMDKSAPSLCPGDSGGPLLLRVGETWRIAGIAADYSFTGTYEHAGSIPMTNLHTRLDDQSRHQIGKWLRLGADTDRDE